MRRSTAVRETPKRTATASWSHRHDGTEHLNRLQCVVVVPADLTVVLHDLLLPSSLDRHEPECSSADAPFARRNAGKGAGFRHQAERAAVAEELSRPT